MGARLSGREWATFRDAVRDAVMDGPRGEAELVRALAELPRGRQLFVIASLGDAQGDLGPAALRRVLAEPGASRDMRCAAVLALAKRCGADASDDLAQALASRDGPVKDYAMVGLAGAADDRAWEQAFARLRQLLRRPAGQRPTYRQEALAVQSPVVAAICYLARHLAANDRRRRLIRVLRGQRDHLADAEQAWLAQMWPGCAPRGPDEAAVPPPDAAPLQRWIRNPLFRPLP